MGKGQVYWSPVNLGSAHSGFERGGPFVTEYYDNPQDIPENSNDWVVRGYVFANVKKTGKTTATVKCFMGIYGLGVSIWQYNNNATCKASIPGYGSASTNTVMAYTDNKVNNDGLSGDLIEWDRQYLDFTSGISIDIDLPKDSDDMVTVSFSQTVPLPENSGYKNIHMYDFTGTVSITIPQGEYYTAPTNFEIFATSSTINSIKVKATWTEGSKTSTAYAGISAGAKDQIGTESGCTGTLTGLSSNKKYTIYGGLSDTKTTLTDEDTYWTVPVVNSPSLSLKSGSEHNTIEVSTSAEVSSPYDQFAYRIDGGSWSGWTTSKTYSFNGLAGYSNHIIGVKMRNTSSGFESTEKTDTLRTWYNPLTGLAVNLVNNWFWYLLVNCSFSYQGGVSNITKYEFDIGGQGYRNKGTTNSHSRGTTSPTGSGKLNYNTGYLCKVRVTDNHGRTYEDSATFSTLDERCLYVDGSLKEMKVIEPDGSVTVITPNLLTVINPDGTTCNMNKVINNDNRTKYE